MIYRTIDEIIDSAMINTKVILREISKKHNKTIKYNEKIKKRVKK